MIMIKTRDEIAKMRAASRIVAEILQELKGLVQPGVTTGEIDRVAEELIRQYGAEPAFKGYRVAGHTFPRCICISINDEIVHGIPSDRRVLQDGDIVGLDFGVRYGGFYGDSAITMPVGTASADDERLIRATRESLQKGIDQARPGNRMGDVSAAIQKHAEGAGFAVVREFVGHGIGRRLHEEPQVPNYGSPGRGVRLRPGMVLAIEPMLNAGRAGVRIKADGWTAVTEDGARSAHFEHSVAVTETGPEVLSQV